MVDLGLRLGEIEQEGVLAEADLDLDRRVAPEGLAPVDPLERVRMKEVLLADHAG